MLEINTSNLNIYFFQHLVEWRIKLGDLKIKFAFSPYWTIPFRLPNAYRPRGGGLASLRSPMTPWGSIRTRIGNDKLYGAIRKGKMQI